MLQDTNGHKILSFDEVSCTDESLLDNYSNPQRALENGHIFINNPFFTGKI